MKEVGCSLTHTHSLPHTLTATHTLTYKPMLTKFGTDNSYVLCMATETERRSNHPSCSV